MEKFTEEGLAILLLTSDLLYRRTNNDIQKPLTPGEWNKFASLLRNSSYSTPASLYGKNEETLMKDLLINRELADRICSLLKYAGTMAVEIEKLASLGIWIATRGDKNYPQRVKKLLKEQSPPFFYGAGRGGNLGLSAVGFVGSRDADSISIEFTKRVVRKIVDEGVCIVSGGAKGIDIISQEEALASGGNVVSYVHSELETLIKKKEYRKAIVDGKLTLLSAVHPSARFTGFNAMGRNKYIYTHSKGTVVVASNQKGGTWEGAKENLKNSWVPLIIREGENVPMGNLALIEMYQQHPLVIPYSENSNQSVIELLKNTNNLISNKEIRKIQNIDLYNIVWPTIQEQLKKGNSEQELCKLLNVLPEQLELWIKRGSNDESKLFKSNTEKFEQGTFF